VLLHGFVVFKLGELSFWSGFRPEHYYLAWGSMVLGWSLCALAASTSIWGWSSRRFGIGCSRTS
jgi:uncharacterized sulfatase